MENYKTRHLAEAGVLIIKEMPLLRIEREDKVCWFVFAKKSECEQIASQYFFGKVLVNARDYYEALNRLKNRIFS